MIAHGIDNFQTGMNQALTGHYHDPLTVQLFEKTGMSHNAAHLTNDFMGIVGTLSGSALQIAKAASTGFLHPFDISKSVQIAGGAYNRSAFEQYKVILRSEMEKPYILDSGLKRLVNFNYRPHAGIGSGSTAAAIRHELATGERLFEKLHSQKGRDMISALEKWLKNNPTSRPGDRAAAENIIKDLQNALGE